MSKKAPVKKSKRRLKRSVRRSLAAVLMITAIGVAAIPVPENAAAPEGGVATYAVTDHTVNYSYPITDGNAEVPDSNTYKDYKYNTTAYDFLAQPEDLSDANPDIEKAYVIRPLGNQWQLDWQFKFFYSSKAGSSGGAGVICQYNDDFGEETVTLDININYEFVQIEESRINNFYTDMSEDHTYVLSFLNPGSDVDNFFERYFPEEYREYAEAYNAWFNYTGDPENRPEKPADRTRKASELTLDDDRFEYFCSKNRVDPSNNSSTSLDGCTLVKVIDREKSGTGGDVTNVYVYIPRLLDGKNEAGRDFDDNHFLVKSQAEIGAIGDRAFYYIQNVHYLTVPDDIRYIGDSAFEHSFIRSISFSNVARIGNRAFKDCTQLSEITMGEKTNIICTEAFYNTGIESISFPYSISEIGPGAFARCDKLTTIDFSNVTQDLAIYDYAFYNDRALNSVNFKTAGNASTTIRVTTIGKAAFATESITGNMTSFEFPSTLSTVAVKNGSGEGDDYAPFAEGLGDLILAGRNNLEYVVFPADLGRNNKATLPDDILYNCSNLSYIVFPDDGLGSCGYVTYNSKVFFSTITNPDFYVRGPELNRGTSGTYASPRMATWEAETPVSSFVPYVYKDRNGVEYYEVSDGTYLLCVNEKGVLTSCTLIDEGSSKLIPVLEIPAVVGNIRVTEIASNCFSDGVANLVQNLVIEDNSISSIGDSVFRGDRAIGRWQHLESVVIGNSVKSIGANAFAGCRNLVDVTFHKPSSGEFTIGTDAFRTEGNKLTFHGEIQKGYAPFDWALDPDNVIDPVMGTRVCYKSLAPSCLTVMYDVDTGYVTLLDYPKYDQIPDLLEETHKWEILLGKYENYGDMMAWQNYINYSVDAYNNLREEFWKVWQSAPSPEKAYESDYYGPWVYPDCYVTSNNEGDSSENSSMTDQTNQDSILDSALQTLDDFFFEPIVAYAATGYPAPYYETYPYDVLDNYENGRDISNEERELIDATKNIVVPAGVESIDVANFVGADSNSPNFRNAGTYLFPNSLTGGGLAQEVYDMYTVHKDDGQRGSVPGLFSGYYRDYKLGEDDVSGNGGVSGNDNEKYDRGNDRIESVTLTSVKYLPDYAFDSCERLDRVVIGEALEDIGTSPFRGCYSLLSVSNNAHYTTEEGIIYHTDGNTDGSYTIEEVLAARGRITPLGVGAPTIGVSTDSNLGLVSTIKPSAFEDCDSITTVDLTGTAGLIEIPENCFRDCDGLQTVLLPRSVNSIEEGAFVHDNILSVLSVPGKEVFISGRAFDETDNKLTTKVRTFENSSAKRYVDTYGNAYNLQWEDIGDEWQVMFLDMNGTQLGDIIYVENNTRILGEYIPAAPERENYVFSGWVGTNGITPDDYIVEDTIFVAQYYSTSGMVDGKYVVDFYDGVDGKIFNTQYVEPGKDATEPREPVHAGYTFLGWSDTFTNIQANKSIIALYSGGGNSSSGGGTNPSGTTTTGSSGSTTTGSNGTTTTGSSGSTTTGSNGSTSNTSDTSTSATSTTSEAAGTYTLTVINGSGSGSYAAGATVIITASLPATGQVFNKWTTETEGITFTNSTLSTTTFTMPASNATVTAEFVAGSGAVPASAAGRTDSPVGAGVTNDGNTRVDITKPGISNKDLATANVNGSTDNFVVKISETPEATQAVANALTNKYGNLENILYYAMDISLYDSTGITQIPDITGLTVDITIPIPDALVAYGGNNMAGAVVSDQIATDQLEDLGVRFSTINGVPCISFTATHFSPYTIYVDTSNLAAGMLDVTPKTGDPIHPKWFLSLGLACLSVILFIKKDKKVVLKKA